MVLHPEKPLEGSLTAADLEDLQSWVRREEGRHLAFRRTVISLVATHLDPLVDVREREGFLGDLALLRELLGLPADAPLPRLLDIG